MKQNSIGSPKIILSRGVGGGNITPSSTGYIPHIDIFYVSNSFDGTLTLSYTPINKTERVVYEGSVLSPGINEDYTLSVSAKKITFNRSDFELDDVIPPMDGLLKLYEYIGNYDVIQGCYFNKGEGANCHIYGNPQEHPKNYVPQIPIPDTVMEANGLGMGFNLFKMDCFTRMSGPVWFKTQQEYIPNVGARVSTQDIYFYDNGAKLGFKYACTTHVKCGHLDTNTNIIW